MASTFEVIPAIDLRGGRVVRLRQGDFTREQVYAEDPVLVARAFALAGASRQTFADESLLKEHVRLELKRFIQKETGAKPVIVPVIQQV